MREICSLIFPSRSTHPFAAAVIESPKQMIFPDSAAVFARGMVMNSTFFIVIDLVWRIVMPSVAVMRTFWRSTFAMVLSGKPTITPAETAHHSAIPGHLSLISMLVGRKIKWDAEKEQILGDPEAAKLLSRPYRPPWKLG